MLTRVFNVLLHSYATQIFKVFQSFIDAFDETSNNIGALLERKSGNVSFQQSSPTAKACTSGSHSFFSHQSSARTHRGYFLVIACHATSEVARPGGHPILGRRGKRRSGGSILKNTVLFARLGDSDKNLRIGRFSDPICPRDSLEIESGHELKSSATVQVNGKSRGNVSDDEQVGVSYTIKKQNLHRDVPDRPHRCAPQRQQTMELVETKERGVRQREQSAFSRILFHSQVKFQK